MSTSSLTTHPLVPLPAWQGPLPGVGEFAALLNILTDATVVLDRASGQLAFGNRGFFELAGLDPLNPGPLSLKALLPDFEQGWSSGEERETELHFAAGKRMPVWASVNWLDKPGQWLLVRLVPLNVYLWRNTQNQREQSLLEFMEELAGLNTQIDLDASLELVLDIGQRMLSAQGLCVYRADTQPEPRLIRVMTLGALADALPERLPLDEPSQVYAPSIWLSNQRAITDLQQAAKQAELASVISVPIELNGSRLGLLAAIDLPPQNAHKLIAMLEILAAHLASALNHYVTLNNLRRTVWEHSRALATRNAIAENSLEGIILLNPALRVLDLNPAAEMMLGYATQEVAGQRVENILVGGDKLPAALRLAHKGLSTPNLGNTSLHRRSGQAFPAHLQVFPVQVNGEMSSIVLLIRDISEKEEIRTRTQQLEQRALLGEVTAIFAHEVRNPVNNISTGLQLMGLNMPPEDPNANLVERMQNDCNRLTHLMESVLSFARPMEYKLIPTDLGNLLKKILERWHPRMSRLNIEGRIQIEPGTPPALADGRALDQVFTNLVSNALTAMQETGGMLAIKVEKAESAAGRPWVRISISDTGLGIPEAAREKIFEPFYTTSPQGTGLGLAITKRIILAHKGKIEVNSFPGGTIFTLLIPGAESESEL